MSKALNRQIARCSGFEPKTEEVKEEETVVEETPPPKKPSPIFQEMLKRAFRRG